MTSKKFPTICTFLAIFGIKKCKNSSQPTMSKNRRQITLYLPQPDNDGRRHSHKEEEERGGRQEDALRDGAVGPSLPADLGRQEQQQQQTGGSAQVLFLQYFIFPLCPNFIPIDRRTTSTPRRPHPPHPTVSYEVK